MGISYSTPEITIQAFALDLDGTMLRSEHIHCANRQRVFARYGVKLTEDD